MVNRWRRCARNENGVVLVLTAILLTVFLGMAALAIDVGSFDAAQRKAQSAADAGALAAARDLAADPSGATSTTDAQTYAKTYNYPSATVKVTAPYGTGNTQAKVTVSSTSPSYFGRIFGVTKANISATAVAGETTTSAACSSPGTGCYAIFAMNTSCSTDDVTFQGGGYNIQGGVHSNGSITLGGGGSKFGPTTYGNGSGCNTGSGGGGNTFTSGPTAEAPITTWPLDYSKQYPACSGSSCTGPNGTPSYCNFASATGWNFGANGVIPQNAIYCAYGTGNPADPATYTGTIAFVNGGQGSSSNPIKGTYLAGKITSSSGGWYLQAYNYPTNKLIGYAAASAAVNLGGGGNSFNGDFFAPNGSITIAAGSQTTGFLEGQTVALTAGGLFYGDGPPDTGSSSSTTTTALLQ